MGTRNLAAQLILGAGIVGLVIGLVLLFYAAFIDYVGCVVDPCSGLLTTFFVSVLVTGIGLTVIGIAAIVFFLNQERKEYELRRPDKTEDRQEI